jgi:hypothetical protein
MSGTGDSRGVQKRIGAEAKASFLEALRGGASREDAAIAAGFSLMGFYGARRRDPAFAEAWVEALASSAAAERRSLAYAERGARAERGELRIACANRRIYQRRVRRNVRFDARAQALFLGHFALTCDMRSAAAEAGVAESTVKRHRLQDPAFAEAFDHALAEGYSRLESKMLAERIEAQRRLRDAIESAAPDKLPRILLEEAAEFDRVMKLLARWDRGGGRIGFREVRHGRRRSVSFDDAIHSLGKRLRALGIPIKPLPEEEQ